MLDDFLKSFYLAKSGRRVLKESLLDHKLGPIWWQLSFDPAFDEDSNVIGVYCTATDITEVKLSAIALAERDKKLHSIALIQSHELRKPVASILGLINLFKINNYQVDADEFQMLERAATELDETIHEIVNYVSKNT
jgi:light-regulated signal transduction histidine kinase (bacteriophytochrome)